MATDPQHNVPAAVPGERTEKPTIIAKVFGVGNAGTKVVDALIRGGLPPAACVVVNSDSQSLATCAAAEKISLETKFLRGLGTGGDPNRGRDLAEEHGGRLKSLCEGAEVIFIVAGLGGGAGTGISPLLTRAAKEAGARVLAFVTTPFDCEGSRRQRQALQGLEELKAAADGVICLPNQKVFKLMDETTSVLQAFDLTNGLLADGVRGLWRLLMHTGLIEIHLAEVFEFIRRQHSESAFAVAEATGATRSREALDKLLAHPLLDQGELLAEADAVLVSLMGGPELTMAEVNRVMEQISGHCPHAQVLMGATIDEAFRERLAVTLIAARTDSGLAEAEPSRRGTAEELDTQPLNRSSMRPGSRFVPPPPTLAPEQMRQMLTRQRAADSRGRRGRPRMRQGQLPLEIVSKGRFDKSEPTIHKGEDLDVPTYLRRGVALN